MKARHNAILALICALIFTVSPATLFAQQDEQPAELPQDEQPEQKPRDDSDEYAPQNPETGEYDAQHDSAYVDTSLQSNIVYTPDHDADASSEPHTDDSQITPTAVDLISPIELHFALHRFNPSNTHGFDIGIQGAYYFNHTMLDGWNGIDYAFRMGNLRQFSVLGRLVTPWTFVNSPNLNLAAGLGAELATAQNYLAPLLSLRLGLAAGPLELRTEYDFHFTRQAHHVRTYIPLPFHIGIGLELAFNRKDRPLLHLHQTAATIFLHF